MFRLTSSHLEAPQGVDPDIQTFAALWDPQWLQNKKIRILYRMSEKDCTFSKMLYTKS